MALSLHRYVDPIDAPGCVLTKLLKLRMKNIRERSMSITIATENAERLPENMVFEILSWLPVKDVLQCKAVCKSWYDVISTPQFISKHLKNNRYYDENCLLAQFHRTEGGRQLYELFFDQTPRCLAHQVLHEIPMRNKANIYGPCDGLYYLYARDFRAIWNPTINEVTTLPPLTTMLDPPRNTKYCMYDCYGFGLDPLSGDYKVVIIKDYWSTTYPQSVLVYSLSNDSWKYCGDLVRNYYLEHNTCYIFVKGCCFWLGAFNHDDEYYSEIIITFDMTSDSFQEISLP